MRYREHDILEATLKQYWRATRLREWGWEQIMSGRCGKFPPAELITANWVP
jgi:hypothetical protein